MQNPATFFSKSGGTFTSTTNTFTLHDTTSTFTHSGGTFNHATGTFTNDGANSDWDPGGVTFYNLTLNNSNASTASDLLSNFSVTNKLHIQKGTFSSSTERVITITGNLQLGNNSNNKTHNVIQM